VQDDPATDCQFSYRVAGQLVQSSNNLTSNNCNGICSTTIYFGVDCQVLLPSKLGGSVSGMAVKCLTLLLTLEEVTIAESYDKGAKSRKTRSTPNFYVHTLHYC